MYLSIKRKKKGNYYIIGKFGGGQPQPIDYSKIPMFFENVDNKDITLKLSRKPVNTNLEISFDNNVWNTWQYESGYLTKVIPVGGKLYIRITTNRGYFNDTNIEVNSPRFSSDGFVSVGGNIMSLSYIDFIGKITLNNAKEFCYAYLFGLLSDKLMDASKLVLPATTLANNCYNSMFRGCSKLTTAPSLPATQLASYCYNSMFSGCSSLTTAPTLPATTLANNCYNSMFRGCSKLTTAPSLPATQLASYCYNSMFSGCSSLTTAPTLPATTLANNCYNSMFYECESLTEIPELPATTLTDNCYNQMFYYCTSLTTAPELPATTLASGCYYLMFGNTKVNKIITYAKDISASSCLYYWLYNISPTGDFYNLGGATYPSGASGIPTGWTEHKTLD